MEAGIPARLSHRDEARRFGLTVGGAFLVLGAIALLRGRRTFALVFGVVGVVLVLCGTLLPHALVPVRRVWMGVATAMSKVTSPIFLGVVYFGLFTPVGAVRRLFGLGPLKPQPSGSSRWVVRDSGARTRGDMEHQF